MQVGSDKGRTLQKANVGAELDVVFHSCPSVHGRGDNLSPSRSDDGGTKRWKEEEQRERCRPIRRRLVLRKARPYLT